MAWPVEFGEGCASDEAVLCADAALWAYKDSISCAACCARRCFSRSVARRRSQLGRLKGVRSRSSLRFRLGGSGWEIEFWRV